MNYKKKSRERGIRAWLVTWEWAGDVTAVADKVVAVLNPRWPVERVSSTVEAIYSICSCTIEEMVTFTRRPELKAYKGENDKGIVTCGNNPWLEARKVSDLIVEVDEQTGLETVKWNELPRYERIEDRVEKVRELLPQQFTRRITGPPSNMAIYDRAEGTFKPGWGPDEVPKRNDL
jgi:hypothetical protein